MRDKVCEYFPCIVAKISGRDCADTEKCQTNKFYKRYGEDYSSFVSEGRIESKNLEKCIKS